MAEPRQLGAAAADAGVDPHAGSTFTVGLVGVLITVATVVLLEALFFRTVDGEQARKTAAAAIERRDLVLAEQQALLEGYRTIDREAGIVAIPIERAMELVLREHAGERP